MKKNLPSLVFSFIVICSASRAEGQFGVTLLVKTEIQCNWKLDGRAMGLLTSDHPIVVFVVPGVHLVEAVPTNEANLIHVEVKVDKSDTLEKIVDIGLQSPSQQQMGVHQSETSKEQTSVDDSQVSTWTDHATGLMWTSRDNGSDIDQPQADAYCSALRYASHDGWRLPTLDELQGIYDPHKGPNVRVISGIEYEVHIDSHLSLTTGSVWSNRLGDNPGRPYQVAWLFQFFDSASNFDRGKPQKNFLHFTFHMRALCVRRYEM